MALISFSTQTRVRYKDTDQMGIMHHSNYVVLYETARTEWLREMGLTYAEIERRGIMSPIIEVHTKFLYPAFYDEMLTIKVSMNLSVTKVPSEWANGTRSCCSSTMQRDTSPTRGTTRFAA